MNKVIEYCLNNLSKTDDKYLQLMDETTIKKVVRFHKSFKEYNKTPLVSLKNMSNYLGVSDIFIKDESYRFNLNAFKVLGGTYAIGHYIADILNIDIDNVDYDYLTSEQFKKNFSKATFLSATDGNHGRGVAWACKKLGQDCIIFMPKGTTKERFDNIKNEGAKVSIEDLNYDECVRLAESESKKYSNGIIVQDTAWDGYEKIPSYIMQGYGTMAYECFEDLNEIPTHIFVQAGVGSLAGSVVGFFSNVYKDNPPKFIIVEADAASCLYKSCMAGDGNVRIVDGDMNTIMAGLACGEPNIISWDILKNHSDCFISLSDEGDLLGMRMLAAPLKGDSPITSGESGAAGFSAFVNIMLNDEYSQLKRELGIDNNSKILFFNTEGNTDKTRYDNIIWKGLNK